MALGKTYRDLSVPVLRWVYRLQKQMQGIGIVERDGKGREKRMKGMHVIHGEKVDEGEGKGTE